MKIRRKPMKIRRIPRFFPLEEIPWDRGEWLSGWAWYSQGGIHWRGQQIWFATQVGQYWGDQTWNNAGWAARGKKVQLNTWNFVALCLFTIGLNPNHEILLTRFFCCICSDAHYFLIPKPKKHARVLMLCPSTSQLPAVQRDLWRDGAQQLWLIGGLGLLA